jgi:hypothetical protein
VFRFPGPRFIPRGSAKLVVNFTESRTRGPCQHSRSGKSGSAPVLMNKPERVHTGEQIHFPHLAKNERDMGPTHSCGSVRVLTAAVWQASLLDTTKLSRLRVYLSHGTEVGCSTGPQRSGGTCGFSRWPFGIRAVEMRRKRPVGTTGEACRRRRSRRGAAP